MILLPMLLRYYSSSPPTQYNWKITIYNFVKSFFYIIVVNVPSYELVLESVFVIVGSPMCSPLALPLQWFRPILCIGTISKDRVLFTTESYKPSIESHKSSKESRKSSKESRLKVPEVIIYPHHTAGNTELFYTVFSPILLDSNSWTLDISYSPPLRSLKYTKIHCNSFIFLHFYTNLLHTKLWIWVNIFSYPLFKMVIDVISCRLFISFLDISITPPQLLPPLLKYRIIFDGISGTLFTSLLWVSNVSPRVLHIPPLLSFRPLLGEISIYFYYFPFGAYKISPRLLPPPFPPIRSILVSVHARLNPPQYPPIISQYPLIRRKFILLKQDKATHNNTMIPRVLTLSSKPTKQTTTRNNATTSNPKESKMITLITLTSILVEIDVSEKMDIQSTSQLNSLAISPSQERFNDVPAKFVNPLTSYNPSLASVLAPLLVESTHQEDNVIPLPSSSPNTSQSSSEDMNGLIHGSSYPPSYVSSYQPPKVSIHSNLLYDAPRSLGFGNRIENTYSDISQREYIPLSSRNTLNSAENRIPAVDPAEESQSQKILEEEANELAAFRQQYYLEKYGTTGSPHLRVRSFTSTHSENPQLIQDRDRIDTLSRLPRSPRSPSVASAAHPASPIRRIPRVDPSIRTPSPAKSKIQAAKRSQDRMKTKLKKHFEKKDSLFDLAYDGVEEKTVARLTKVSLKASSFSIREYLTNIHINVKPDAVAITEQSDNSIVWITFDNQNDALTFVGGNLDQSVFGDEAILDEDLCTTKEIKSYWKGSYQLSYTDDLPDEEIISTFVDLTYRDMEVESLYLDESKKNLTVYYRTVESFVSAIEGGQLRTTKIIITPNTWKFAFNHFEYGEIFINPFPGYPATSIVRDIKANGLPPILCMTKKTWDGKEKSPFRVFGKLPAVSKILDASEDWMKNRGIKGDRVRNKVVPWSATAKKPAVFKNDEDDDE